MTTWLLTWNPSRSPWDMSQDLADLERNGYFEGRWSCGNTKRIIRGDRVFLLRQGLEPRGVIASGYAQSSPTEDVHWQDSRKNALYIGVQFDKLLNPSVGQILRLNELNDGTLSSVHWRTQASGISLSPAQAEELEAKWNVYVESLGIESETIPEELPQNGVYLEGTVRKITVNAYERNALAKKECIEYYGSNCYICGFTSVRLNIE